MVEVTHLGSQVQLRNSLLQALADDGLIDGAEFDSMRRLAAEGRGVDESGRELLVRILSWVDGADLEPALREEFERLKAECDAA
ncbi:MAG TPA: hypothetical protein VMT50_03105 [Steroidobacteraceae bacterium]|nr:hypothetical protein [Steroidobacteraceae bacterium]